MFICIDVTVFWRRIFYILYLSGMEEVYSVLNMRITFLHYFFRSRSKDEQNNNTAKIH